MCGAVVYCCKCQLPTAESSSRESKQKEHALCCLSVGAPRSPAPSCARIALLQSSLPWAAVRRLQCRTTAHGKKLSKIKIMGINLTDIWCANGRGAGKGREGPAPVCLTHDPWVGLPVATPPPARILPGCPRFPPCSKEILQPDVPHSLRLQGILIGGHSCSGGRAAGVASRPPVFELCCVPRVHPWSVQVLHSSVSPFTRLGRSQCAATPAGGVVIVFNKQQIYLLGEVACRTSGGGGSFS